MRIGIFGGSFDPIHIGHLIVAEAAADRLPLDRVHFVPASQQPHKLGEHRASVEDRIAMLELAVAHNPRFALDRREADRAGTSYTVDTLRSLSAEFPEDELFLLVGADAAARLSTWREGDVVRQLASVTVLSRPGAGPASDSETGHHLEVPAIGVSATAIREAVARGDSIRYLVPAGVAAYIAAHELYRTEGSC